MRTVSVELPDAAYWQRQVKCQDACPVNTDARGYVRAIAEGRFEDAYLIARGPNPLASICGRVCGAPCEAACRRGDVDKAVSIRALKRFAVDRGSVGLAGAEPRELIARLVDHAARRQCSRSEELAALARFVAAEGSAGQEGPKIAIIGSGPAGLAAAHDLAVLGFRPTVYEMEPIPAGMLAVGIPQYRLPAELIAAEVEFIRKLGVEFLCNTTVGVDISLGEIRRRHEATIVAVGLKKSARLRLPGADGPGVLGGVELLRDVALEKPVKLHGDVVVIGGGNVAYDVARTVVRQTGVDVSRTALRQSGVGRVHLCCLESLGEMPADDIEIIEGDEEGVIRHHSLGPKEILRDGEGMVAGVAFKRVLQVFDEEGHFAPEFDQNDVTTIPANTVIWAIGQRADLSLVDSEADIRRTDIGLIECDAQTLRTSAEDVFVAGDVVYGPRLLIDAVASGKRAARRVYEYLRGKSLAEASSVVHCDVPDYAREADYEKIERTPIPVSRADQRKRSQTALVELGYDGLSAACEGSRCFDCGVNTIFDSSKCILCGGCADVCPEVCLQLVSLDRLEGGGQLAAAIAHRLGSPRAAGHSAIVKDETKCIRCGLCAQRCPVDAITMERAAFGACWQSGAGPEPAPGGGDR